MDQEGLELWFCGLHMLELALICPAFFQLLERAESFYQSHFFRVVQNQEGPCQGKLCGSSPACSSGAGGHKGGT